MSPNDILVRLRYLDAYPKTLEDFRIKTYGGAAGKQNRLISVAVLSVTPVTYVLGLQKDYKDTYFALSRLLV